MQGWGVPSRRLLADAERHGVSQFINRKGFRPSGESGGPAPTVKSLVLKPLKCLCDAKADFLDA
jgi:hypothetical protein